ncbi:MAG: hypothetical protein FK732_00320 [Asgard group archaeon]|nr:hypothetical protein [Asgard group archaeon]
MNKKILVFVVLMTFSLLLTPLVLAKPGAEKNNDKFEYFELVVSGSGSGTWDREVISPPEGAPPNVIHRRGGGWDPTTVDLVELTVGDEVFTMTTDPYNVDYSTSYDIEIFLDETGTATKYNIRLTDLVTVFDEDEEIGTIVLKIKATVDLSVMPPAYQGTIMGYGTEALKGVHISAEDLGMTAQDPNRYTRIGTITGWPEEITNDV